MPEASGQIPGAILTRLMRISRIYSTHRLYTASHSPQGSPEYKTRECWYIEAVTADTPEGQEPMQTYLFSTFTDVGMHLLGVKVGDIIECEFKVKVPAL